MSLEKYSNVTLFSNGMGHFRRIVNVPAGLVKNISIPFKREHIADVLESLSVFGNVKLARPPSFTPTNSNSTSLSIDPKNAGRSMFTALSGATVQVRSHDYGLGFGRYSKKEGDDFDPGLNANVEGVQYTLLGLEEIPSADDGQLDMLAVMRDGEVFRFLLDTVTVEFLDDAVRSEIDKALKNNFQRIKPDSTFLDLAVEGVDIGEPSDGQIDETAIIQYKIPVAAWKMRYNVRQDGDKFLLEGTAIIDNNTDEDWNDTLISVVTGNPISFYSPDLAAINVPQRQTVNIVEANALGLVGGADAESVGSGRNRDVAARAACPPPSAAYTSMAFGNTASFGLGGGGCAPEFGVAVSSGVESKDVGDFCIFTSKEPISIASKRSAIVPMFTVPLTSAGSILLYKEENHASRPFRAVKFKNETGYSLGRGKVVIYQDGVFSGEAVLEAAKPGENRLLPHRLENGVKIVKENKGTETALRSINISHGVAVQQHVYTATTEYALTNKKNETFKVLIEHTRVLSQAKQPPEFSGVEVKEVEKTTNGNRVYIELAPNESITLTVTERFVSGQKVHLVGNFHWIVQNIFNPKLPLADHARLRTCSKLQTAIDACSLQIAAFQNKMADMDEDAERLRRNIEATKSAAKDGSSEAADIVSNWVVGLNNLDKEIRDIRKVQISALEAEREQISEGLDIELERIFVDWVA